MYKEGDLIKIDFDQQILLGRVSWKERWLQCPYAVVYENQQWGDIVRVAALVHTSDGYVGRNPTPLYVYTEGSKLIERESND